MKIIVTYAAIGASFLSAVVFGILFLHIVVLPIAYLLGLFFGLRWAWKSFVSKMDAGSLARMLIMGGMGCAWTGLFLLL